MTKRVSMFALAFFCAASSALAQQPAGKQVAKSPSKKAAAAAEEVDPMAEVRRTTAISLVNTLADDARMFRDPALRGRVQARAADALWDTDRERAVLLFRRAWDEAEAADAESDRKLEEDKRRQIREQGFASIQLPPSLRTEVLRLAAKRDRTLGEEFLAKMEEARKREAENAVTSNDRATDASQNNGARPDPTEATAAVAKRLRLAVQLLDDNDVERATQFADPALGAVNIPALEFLARLRTKNAQAADQRFASLLTRAASDPASDANTVSLLSSYLFTPALYVTFEADGGTSSNSWSNSFPAPSDVSPQLRAGFFRAAASVLLRPTPAPEQDRTSAGRRGWYMVIARLLPLFDQFAPERSAALRAKMASLAPDAPDAARQNNHTLTEGLVPEDPSRDRVQETLSRLDGAKTTEERDIIYADAAIEASRKEDARAEEFLNKIDDADLRKRVRSFVDFQATQAALKDKDTAAVLKYARGGTLSPIQRAWAYTETARTLAKSEPGRAAEILDEALADARDHIDAASPERVRALVAVATQMAQLDRARVWEVMLEVVKASNAAKEFTGEDARLGARLQTKNGVMMTSTTVGSFDLNDIFAKLAAEDMQRAVELARAFDGESPRAVATLAVARYVLSKGGKL
jgi:hypothetical protein